MTKDKILITGATGFIGKILIEHLYNENDDLILTSRNLKDLKILKYKFPKVSIIAGDLIDKNFVDSILKDVNVIYHLAGYKFVNLSESNIMDSVKGNILIINNLLESISLLNKTIKIKIITTNKTVNIKGVYGATKFISERLANDFAKKNKNILVDIVCLTNIFGSPGSIGEVWKKNIKKNREIKITNLDCTRFFLTQKQAILLLKSEKLNMDSIKAVKMEDLLQTLILKYNKNYNTKLINKIGLGNSEDMHEFFPLKKTPSNLNQTYSMKELYQIL